MPRYWALVLVSSGKALARMGLNIIIISLMNGEPCPKNNVIKSLLGENQMVWVKAKVEASIAGANVAWDVAEMTMEEMLEMVLGGVLKGICVLHHQEANQHGCQFAQEEPHEIREERGGREGLS